MKIRNILFGLILYTLYSILYTSPISAHIVESDNTVGAVMHIDPGDQPVALEKSTVLLELKDTKSIFNLYNCDCLLSVNLQDKQILSLPVLPVSEDDKLSAAIPIVFPEKGIYKLKISGKPKEDVDFKDFELIYEVNVIEISVSPSPLPESGLVTKTWVSRHIPHLIGGVLIFLFLIFALIKQSRNK